MKKLLSYTRPSIEDKLKEVLGEMTDIAVAYAHLQAKSFETYVNRIA